MVLCGAWPWQHGRPGKQAACLCGRRKKIGVLIELARRLMQPPLTQQAASVGVGLADCMACMTPFDLASVGQIQFTAHTLVYKLDANHGSNIQHTCVVQLDGPPWS
mgnify:CR=1 FL=1